MREVLFHSDGFNDLKYWAEVDLKVVRKIIELINDTRRDPFNGIGNPEPLKFEWQGYWSRRINQEHRLVYKVTDKYIIVAQCRYHY